MNPEGAPRNGMGDLSPAEGENFRDEFTDILRSISGGEEVITRRILEAYHRGSLTIEQARKLADMLDALRREVKDDLKREANVDRLTQLVKTSVLIGSIQERAAEHKPERRKGKSDCVIMIDVDRLREINNKYGHQAGNAILKELGAFLGGVIMRKEDEASRYGGDEFVLYVGRTGIKGAQEVCRRIIERLQKRRFYVSQREGERQFVVLNVSMGIAELQGTSDEQIHESIQHADDAAYVAKISGTTDVSRAVVYRKDDPRIVQREANRKAA